MKRLLLLVLVVLLIAGGGGAAWWFFLREPEEAPVAEPTPPALPEFVELTPLVLPLIQKGQVTHHITLKVVLEVDAGEKERVLLAIRQLTDAYLSELHGLFALRFVRRQDNALPLLRKRLLAVSEKLLGPGVVGDVLLSELNRRRPSRS
jgi:hypothetical protein